MEWTMNSVGHIVALVPWVAFLLGVVWYAVRGLVADLRDERTRVAAAGRPEAEPTTSRRPASRPRVEGRVPAAH